jgi:GntR family transcriptional regulator, transcriptional repressor for pyruvate dehydrogenase complex
VGLLKSESMIDSIKPVARTSLSDNIVDQILGLIASGVLKPRDQIPSEKQLCQQFGVGRTSVREALRSLSIMGILKSHAGEGTFVAEDGRKYVEKTLQWSLLLTRKAIDDLVETRLTLESQTTFLAAQRASDADLREMAEAIDGMARSIGQPEAYLEFDLRFHMAIAQASQNSILSQLLGMIRGYLQTWIQQILTVPTSHEAELRARKSVTEHNAILAAIKRRNAEEARQAIIEHLHSSSRDFRNRVPDSNAAAN